MICLLKFLFLAKIVLERMNILFFLRDILKGEGSHNHHVKYMYRTQQTLELLGKFRSNISKLKQVQFLNL